MRMRLLLISDTHGKLGIINELAAMQFALSGAGQSIFLSDYIDLLKASGWQLTHIVDCPLPLRAGGHTAISSKHGEPDAQEPDPGSGSTLLDYRNKEMIKIASWARGPVNYDVIVALRKKEQSEKGTWVQGMRKIRNGQSGMCLRHINMPEAYKLQTEFLYLNMLDDFVVLVIPCKNRQAI